MLLVLNTYCLQMLNLLHSPFQNGGHLKSLSKSILNKTWNIQVFWRIMRDVDEHLELHSKTI